ncbi:MAG: hypothetical protein J6N51_16210 [Selenomonas sp.]|nr:hypothetical protein [Selenomonas ruminantium]MBO6293780.1 hypothetical protein [Selenomonas sp.]
MIGRLQNLVRRNLAAKILCFLVALVLWGYVMNDQNPSIEGTFSVPLTIMNAPEGYKVSQETGAVKLKVRGPRSMFVNASEADFSAYVDLENASNGRKAYRVHTNMPQGFELVEIQPDAVEVTLDRIESREFRAELIVTGATAPGTTVAKVTQTVAVVSVEGPKSLLDEVNRVIGYVGLSGNGTDFSLQVPLTPINIDGREVSGVTVRPSSVQADVQLARGLTKKVVTIKAITMGALPKGLVMSGVKVDPVKIEIAGTDEDLSKITSVETEEIDLSTADKSTSRKVMLKLPEGVTVTNKEVTVYLEIKKSEAKEP